LQAAVGSGAPEAFLGLDSRQVTALPAVGRIRLKAVPKSR
jgi:hypothetical protein